MYGHRCREVGSRYGDKSGKFSSDSLSLSEKMEARSLVENAEGE